MIFAILILVLASIYFYGESNRKIQSLSDQMELTAEYVTEPFVSHEKYSGKIYRHLQNLFEEAEKEILFYSSNIDAPKTDVQENENAVSSFSHVSRERAFKALERRVRGKREQGFRYIFARQIGENNQIVYSHVLNSHCAKMLEYKYAYSAINPKLNIEVLKVNNQSLNTFSYILIDRKFVVIFTRSIDAHGITYSSGILVFQDRKGEMYENLSRHFREVEHYGQPITKAELIDNAKKLR